MTYFVAFRYQRGDSVVDGNAVIKRERGLVTERDVREVEALLSRERLVEPELLGLISICRLG